MNWIMIKEFIPFATEMIFDIIIYMNGTIVNYLFIHSLIQTNDGMNIL